MNLRIHLLAAMCATVVCCADTQPSETPKRAQETQGAQGGEAPPGGEVSNDYSKYACKALADKICQQAGADSPTCKGFGQMSALFPPSMCEAGMKDFAFTQKRLDVMRKECLSLTERLCKDLGEESETCSMVKERVKTFAPKRCGEMMKDYDPVLKELKAQEAAKKPLSDEQFAEAVNAPNAHGPKDAKVTLIEFSDFECPFCAMAGETVGKLKKKYGDEVRIVFRHYPLGFHKKAPLAHQAAIEAGTQGKFWEYHDLLFLNQKSLERQDLEKHAQTLGLNMAKFKQALDKEIHKKQLDEDIELARVLYVTGTPTMFLGRDRVPNASDFDALSKEIDGLLGRAPAAPTSAQEAAADKAP